MYIDEWIEANAAHALFPTVPLRARLWLPIVRKSRWKLNAVQPILLSYALVILLQLLGMRLIDRAIIEFVLLKKNSYEIFQCSHYCPPTEPGGDGVVVFQVLLKEVKLR